jgi:hypothetical protein
MYTKLSLTISFSFLLLSCTNEQSKTPKNEDNSLNSEEKLILSETAEKDVDFIAKTPRGNEPEAAVKELVTPEQDKRNKLAKLLKGREHTSSINLNGEKFTLHSPQFGKGAKVYNVQMKEYGLIKGSIVVVSVDKVNADELSYPSVKVLKIAKNTFRLIPEKSVELMSFYNILNESKSFSMIEMEVDYSPIKESAKY